MSIKSTIELTREQAENQLVSNKLKIYTMQNLEDLIRVLVLSGYKITISKIMKEYPYEKEIDYFFVEIKVED